MRRFVRLVGSLLTVLARRRRDHPVFLNDGAGISVAGLHRGSS
jgi:hypothetical protein